MLVLSIDFPYLQIHIRCKSAEPTYFSEIGQLSDDLICLEKNHTMFFSTLCSQKRQAAAGPPSLAVAYSTFAIENEHVHSSKPSLHTG